MKKLNILVIVLLIIIILGSAFIISKYYEPKLSVWSKKSVVTYIESERTDSIRYLVEEPKKLKLNAVISCKEEDLEGVIIRNIEKERRYFNPKEYKTIIEKNNEDDKNYTVKLVYKIGEFYTNSFYEVIIEDGKITEILDYTIEKRIEPKKINLLKRYSLKTKEVADNIKAIKEGLEIYNSNYQSERINIMYNINTNQQYIVVEYIDKLSGMKNKKFFPLNTVEDEGKFNPLTEFLLNF